MQTTHMTKALVAAVLAAGTVAAVTPPAPAGADPYVPMCDVPACTPGIAPNVVLGAPCSNTTYFVFGSAVAGPSTLPGRLVYCASPRRYEPRWFRSPPMAGIRDEGSSCQGQLNMVAQAPDGLFLHCVSMNGESLWRPGNT